MCGIFGFIKKDNTLLLEEGYIQYQGWQNWNSNTNNTADSTLYKTLLFATALRGIDSTGTTIIDHRDLSSTTRKLPVNAIQFSTLGEYKLIDTLIDQKNIGVIGHCRAGTIGSASYRTSHPFDLSSLVGCHNGTLNNHQSLGIKNTVSDSEAIFYLLNDSKDYVKDIEKFRGSYALVWYDKTVGLYYFCRNDDRSLWYYKTENSLVFASELEILQFGLCRAYNKTVEELRGIGEFNQFTPYTLYEYNKETGEFSKFTIERPVKTTTAQTASDYYSNKKSEYKSYINDRAEKDSPFQEGDSVEIIPCGFTEYPHNQHGHGSLFGYIYYAGKSYFCVSYGIIGVKKFFNNFFDSFPEVKTLYGTITHQSYQKERNEANNMKDILTGVQVHPERNNKDEVLVITIKADSLAVTKEENTKNLPIVTH